MTNNEEQEFLGDLDKKLWTSADKLRATLDAAQYKHTVLGLIFLKYISDSFDIRRQELTEQFKNELKQEFENLIEQIFAKIKNNLFESKELSNLRDTLLPKLLSSELSPGQTEALTETAC